MDIDIIQRARLYSEAVKRHDAQIEKQKSMNTNGRKFCIKIKHYTRINFVTPPKLPKLPLFQNCLQKIGKDLRANF